MLKLDNNGNFIGCKFKVVWKKNEYECGKRVPYLSQPDRIKMILNLPDSISPFYQKYVREHKWIRLQTVETMMFIDKNGLPTYRQKALPIIFME